MTILHCRKKIISAVTLLAVGVGLASFTTPAKAYSSDNDSLLVLVYGAMNWMKEARRDELRQRMTDMFVEQLKDYGNYFEGQNLTPSHNAVPTEGASLLDEPKDGMDVAFGRYSYADQTGDEQTGLSAGDQFSDGVKDKLSTWFNYSRNSFGSSYYGLDFLRQFKSLQPRRRLEILRPPALWRFHRLQPHLHGRPYLRRPDHQRNRLDRQFDHPLYLLSDRELLRYRLGNQRYLHLRRFQS